MTEILTTDSIQVPGGVAPWFGLLGTIFQATDLVPGELVQGEITFPKMSMLLKIGASFPTWIRIYQTDQARQEDLDRVFGVGKANGHGLMAEVATSAARPLWAQSPIMTFDNDDSPRINKLYFTLMNRDSVNRSPEITIIHLPLEG